MPEKNHAYEIREIKKIQTQKTAWSQVELSN